MSRKMIIGLVIIIIALALYVIILFFIPKAKAPEGPVPINFRGPTGAPHVKGPTAPPPGQ